MRRIFQKELDMILHWNLTLVGGFLGTYAILLHAGNFGSAQTGNVMEMAAARDHICFLFFCKFLYSHRSSPPFFSR